MNPIIQFIYRFKKLYFYPIFFLMTCLGSSFLNAAIVNVGPPPASIQAAIDSAQSGDTIQLSTGTYIEPIKIISKSLWIIGNGTDNTIIKAPKPETHLKNSFLYSEVYYWSIILVDNLAAPVTQNVSISNLTVDLGSQQNATNPTYGNSNLLYGIGYHKAGGTIHNILVTYDSEAINLDQPYGGGILAASMLFPNTININNCYLANYQTIGIDCRGESLTANISNCTSVPFLFSSTSTPTATTGIQFSDLAVGAITSNSLFSNQGNTTSIRATGIFLNHAGPDIVISSNAIYSCDNGIMAYDTAGDLTIIGNGGDFSYEAGINSTTALNVRDTQGVTTISNNTFNMPNGIVMDLAAYSSNQIYNLSFNNFNAGEFGLVVRGNKTVGPVVQMDSDQMWMDAAISDYKYIKLIDAPNDIWPSTASVHFDHLVGGQLTKDQFESLSSRIIDKHDDPLLGLAIDNINPKCFYNTLNAASNHPSKPPLITTLQPNNGPETGGNQITVLGNHFTGPIILNFGGIPAIANIINAGKITATVPPGTGMVDVQLFTVFGASNLVKYNYLSSAVPQSPIDFVGKVKKTIVANQKELFLVSNWTASPSEEVVLYRVYLQNQMVAEIPVGSPLKFTTSITSRQQSKKFAITAVDSAGLESTALPIRILHYE